MVGSIYVLGSIVPQVRAEISLAGIVLSCLEYPVCGVLLESTLNSVTGFLASIVVVYDGISCNRVAK